MPAGSVYTFGPFRLDEAARRLTRGDEPVAVTDRQLEVLRVLVDRAGQVVPKEAILDAAWKDVAVGDNSVEQAISSLRRALGPGPDAGGWIETLARRGYRFRAPVERTAARRTDADLEALIAPHRAFVEGVAAIETLERGAVERARRAFTGVVEALPDQASGHIGLANALVLTFEATRADEAPDVAALRAAADRAREACRLDPGSGEAWATLAFILARAGASADAAAAGRRAVALDPDNWRHHLRLAFVTWGEERLGAAERARHLLPGLGLAHWLAATVHVARQAFDDAARELAAGAAAQDRQQPGGRFAAVGLHLLRGLVHLASGDVEAALEAFERELTFETAGHVYAKQASANARCAIGAVRLRQGRVAEAVAAFDAALDRIGDHPMALAALGTSEPIGRRAEAEAGLARRLAGLDARGAAMDAALVRAASAALAGRHEDAARAVLAALETAPPGDSAGWTLPVEPLINAGAHPDVWAAALAALRSRAA